MSDGSNEFLEHFGVKGMKWGVRRAQNRDARTERLRKGTATRRDKFIREADLDGGRTQAIKSGKLKQSKSEKVGMQIAGVLLATVGAIQLAQIRKDIKTNGW